MSEDVDARPITVALREWSSLTGRLISTRVRDWMTDLVDRYGQERVVDALRDEASSGHFNQLLSRARDRLARQALVDRERPAPRELSGAEVMAIIRGEVAHPSGPFTWDSRDLSAEEYLEVLQAKTETGTLQRTVPLESAGVPA